MSDREKTAEKNRRVLQAMKSLLGGDTPPEIDEATFRLEMAIEYPLIDETEQEAKEWLIETLEHDGDKIQMRIESVERTDEQ